MTVKAEYQEKQKTMATSKVKDINLFSVTFTWFLGLKTCTPGFYPGIEATGSKASNQILPAVELRMCGAVPVFRHTSSRHRNNLTSYHFYCT
jgi:hypothetical protein